MGDDEDEDDTTSNARVPIFIRASKLLGQVLKRWIYGVTAAAAVVGAALSALAAYQYATQAGTTRDEMPPAGSEEISGGVKEEMCRGRTSCIEGKVERVIDGDTLVIQRYTVRLSLVDTPERNEAGFEAAKSFVVALCPLGSTAIIDQDDGQPVDRYNRMLGKVFCAGKVLNAELLRNGHAQILTRYCSESEFATEPWASAFGC